MVLSAKGYSRITFYITKSDKLEMHDHLIQQGSHKRKANHAHLITFTSIIIYPLSDEQG